MRSIGDKVGNSEIELDARHNRVRKNLELPYRKSE